MKIAVFKHPTSNSCFARIRDEWNKITCTYKNVVKSWDLTIDSVKEIECEISDFNNLRQIFLHMEILQKAYQERYRETRKIWDNVHFMIDERPGLQPFVEIEWENENIVKEFSEKLWFNYKEGMFWTADEIYHKELWFPQNYINSLDIISFEKPPKIENVGK